MTPIMPPVGLKSIVLSSTAIVLIWSDATLSGRNPRITDNRYYTVRYNPKFQRKYRMINSTEFNTRMDDLKPDTEYEFSVRVTTGGKQSTWSLSTFNRTKESGIWVCLLYYELVHGTTLAGGATHTDSQTGLEAFLRICTYSVELTTTRATWSRHFTTCIHQKTKISSIYKTFPEVTSAFESMHLIGAIEMYIFCLIWYTIPHKSIPHTFMGLLTEG